MVVLSGGGALLLMLAGSRLIVLLLLGLVSPPEKPSLEKFPVPDNIPIPDAPPFLGVGNPPTVNASAASEGMLSRTCSVCSRALL